MQSLLGVGNIDCLLGVSDARMGYLVWVLPFSAIFPMKAALVSVAVSNIVFGRYSLSPRRSPFAIEMYAVESRRCPVEC